jgi:MFS family permease
MVGYGAGAAVLEVVAVIASRTDAIVVGRVLGERALGLYSMALAGGAVAGQILGGVLVSADLLGLRWRPVFLVNVPIGAALVVLGRRLLPGDDGRRERSLDIPGLVALSAAVVLLVVPLVLGHELDWPAWGWAMLAASVVVFAGFVVVERNVARRGGSPLIPAEVLRAPDMVIAAFAIFLGMSTYGGILFSMALHLQSGLGDSPLRAGLTFGPTALGFAATSLTWQRTPEPWHRRLIPVGFVVTAAAYGALALVTRGGGHGGLALPAVLLVIGLGFGAAYSPILTVALRTISPVHAPDASGVLVTTVQLGQVVGVAAFGTLFLGLIDGAALPPTAHAIAVTSVGLAATAAAASLLGLRMALRRAAEPV